MKRLAVKRLPEKLTMAAIILSCGLVMQAEQPSARLKAKAVAAVSNSTHHAQTTHSQKTVRASRVRPQHPAW